MNLKLSVVQSSEHERQQPRSVGQWLSVDYVSYGLNITNHVVSLMRIDRDLEMGALKDCHSLSTDSYCYIFSYTIPAPLHKLPNWKDAPGQNNLSDWSREFWETFQALQKVLPRVCAPASLCQFIQAQSPFFEQSSIDGIRPQVVKGNNDWTELVARRIRLETPKKKSGTGVAKIPWSKETLSWRNG